MMLKCQYPSSSPVTLECEDNLGSLVKAVLDCWESDHEWAVGSGYTDPDEPWDRDRMRPYAVQAASKLVERTYAGSPSLIEK